MKHRRSLLSLFVFILFLSQKEVRAAPIPTMIPHSGTVAVNGTPFNGNGQFKFAIVNTDGSVTWWTNDNVTGLDGTEPTAFVTIPVTNGAFAVKLGDPDLTMAPIQIALFANNSDAFLRVWFSDGATGFQELLPKRQLVSVPYAYRAEVAGSANAVTGSRLVIADPAHCQRSDGVGVGFKNNPYVDVGVIHPASNSFGPSIGTTNVADGVYAWYCPVTIEIPQGSTLTVTGATLASSDFSATCLVGAEIRVKTFGASSFGAVLSTVSNGSNSGDVAFTGGPVTKSFPSFTRALASSEIIFIRAFIQNTGGGGDCRYSGVQLSYAVGP